MRVLILYANPVSTSFGAALHSEVLDALRSRNIEVDDCDLYSEGFDPVLSEQDRVEYHDVAKNRTRLGSYADRLLAADALVLIYPVWNEGFPAILKGFFDRVFVPGVSFKLKPDGSPWPSLGNLKKIAAVCTYGASRLSTAILGDPPKRVVKRMIRLMPGHIVSCQYIAHYGMDHTTAKRRVAFLAKVRKSFEAW